MWKRILKRQKILERSDDNKISFLKRIDTFKNDTMKIVDIYEGKGDLVLLDSEKEEEKIVEDFIKMKVFEFLK